MSDEEVQPNRRGKRVMDEESDADDLPQVFFYLVLFVVRMICILMFL